MKNLSKKEAYLRKKKLIKSIKTVALISFAVILSLLTIIVIGFYFYTKENLGNVTYPKSPLTRMMDTTYSYVADDNLPVMIQCPSIPVILNVGGSERYVTHNGAVFAYGNNLYISVYETNDTSYSILSGQFVSDLYAGESYSDVLYENAQTDVGYFNGYPAEYQSGLCQILNSSGRSVKDIYVVSMTMDLGLDKNLMLVVSSTEDKVLYDAGVLLQSIGYTVMDTSGTNYMDSDESVAETIESGYSNETSNTNVPMSGTVDMPLEVNETAVAIPVTTPTPTPTASPEKEWMDYTVILTQTYDMGTFVLEYQNREKTPIDAVLYSPDGTTTYVPTYWNDGLDGTIRFMVPSPSPGTWTIKTDSSINLGTYSAYCVNSESYVPSMGEASGQPTASPEIAVTEGVVSQ